MKSKTFVLCDVALLADSFIQQIYSSILHKLKPMVTFKQRSTFLEIKSATQAATPSALKSNKSSGSGVFSFQKCVSLVFFT